MCVCIYIYIIYIYTMYIYIYIYTHISLWFMTARFAFRLESVGLLKCQSKVRKVTQCAASPKRNWRNIPFRAASLPHFLKYLPIAMPTAREPAEWLPCVQSHAPSSLASYHEGHEGSDFGFFWGRMDKANSVGSFFEPAYACVDE